MLKHFVIVIVISFGVMLSACGAAGPKEVDATTVKDLSIEALIEGSEENAKIAQEMKENAPRNPSKSEIRNFLERVRQHGLYHAELKSRAHIVANATLDAFGIDQLYFCKDVSIMSAKSMRCNRIDDRMSGRLMNFGIALLKEGYRESDVSQKNHDLENFTKKYRKEHFTY